MYITASWTKTASNVRPSRTVRMSPATCSHSGLSLWLTFRILPEGSTRVMAKACFMCEALLPPPLPSSKTSRTGRRAAARIIST